MHKKEPNDLWTQLAKNARASKPEATEEAAPFGFATRVISRRSGRESLVRPRRYGWLALAFCVVFGTGYAASTLISGSSLAANHPQLRLWGNQMLGNLGVTLNLSADQQEKLVPVIQKKEGEVAELRERALVEYQLLLIQAHDEIAPHLEASQQKRLERSRKLLKNRLEKSAQNSDTLTLP